MARGKSEGEDSAGKKGERPSCSCGTERCDETSFIFIVDLTFRHYHYIGLPQRRVALGAPLAAARVYRIETHRVATRRRLRSPAEMHKPRCPYIKITYGFWMVKP